MAAFCQDAMFEQSYFKKMYSTYKIRLGNGRIKCSSSLAQQTIVYSPYISAFVSKSRPGRMPVVICVYLVYWLMPRYDVGFNAHHPDTRSDRRL